jgi:hypothetical protein
MVIPHLTYPAFLDKTPIRLNDKELDNPLLMMERFFDDGDLNYCRIQLEEWLALGLSADLPELHDWFQRSNMVYFCYQLEALIEANYVLMKKMDESARDALIKPKKQVKKK